MDIKFHKEQIDYNVSRGQVEFIINKYFIMYDDLEYHQLTPQMEVHKHLISRLAQFPREAFEAGRQRGRDEIYSNVLKYDHEITKPDYDKWRKQ